MNTTEFHALHPTHLAGAPGAGKFANKDHPDGQADLTLATPSAYPTSLTSVDGTARVTEDGENQTCECGNDSETDDWAAADRNGHLNPDSLGSGDEEEYAVCPDCGRVYSNADLFKGDAPAVARYDTNSAEFKSALADYNTAVYGG